jgi:sarcosine oxidase delta subunit
MRLFSYVVARDYGFAPNPFFGFCTLATCKPKIRDAASLGDWIVGTGSCAYGLEGRLVYAMRVTEVLTFDQYWRDSRFLEKRPNLRGSVKQAFGDNIYHQARNGRWLQENSHHSHANGCPNLSNVEHDTQTDRILLSDDFVYFGRSGPIIPLSLRNANGADICAKRGHKCNFGGSLVTAFVTWLLSLQRKGYSGRPAEFK